MTTEETVAYVHSQTACALIELEAMKAENANRAMRGETQAYGEQAFNDLINRYGIHHNAVIGIFREVYR
jgi:hypothetical protein